MVIDLAKTLIHRYFLLNLKCESVQSLRLNGFVINFIYGVRHSQNNSQLCPVLSWICAFGLMKADLDEGDVIVLLRPLAQ